jgi:hypothetical protein
MIRSILAVLAGLIVALVLVVVLSFLSSSILGIPFNGPPTRDYLLLNLLGGAIAAASGGAVAVRVAAHTPHGHMFALAIVILILSLATVFSAPAPGQPAWYHVAISVAAPASVLVGGWLASRRWAGRSAEKWANLD